MKHKSETLETVAFTLNREPSKSVDTTPYELWFSKKPKLSFLKVWGCDAYVKRLQPEKLEPKADKCVFRIPKGDNWVYLLSQIRGQSVCR